MFQYFGSKKGLLNAILEKYGNELYEIIKEKAFYKNNITKNLNELAIAVMNFAVNNPDFYRMQLSMIFSHPENDANKAVTAMNERNYNLVEEMFKNASKDHGNMKKQEKKIMH